MGMDYESVDEAEGTFRSGFSQLLTIETTVCPDATCLELCRI